MTREEAKRVLEFDLDHTHNNESKEALRMAIKALEQEPCDVFDEYGNYKYPSDVELTEPNTATSVPCEDAISRQAVSEAISRISLCKCNTNEIDAVDECLRAVKYLPPVNPQPCEDAISRQTVNILVDELARAISDERCFMSRGRSTATIMQDILDLPSVNPQPKTGHWINRHIIANKTIDMIVCSECGEEFSYDAETGISEYKYCPNCGAKMVEPQETETWNGIHAQITAPKGTFERIFNEADDDSDI